MKDFMFGIKYSLSVLLEAFRPKHWNHLIIAAILIAGALVLLTLLIIAFNNTALPINEGL